MEIWNSALRWADEQCRQNDIECSAVNRRKMLGPALFNIRFPLIPKEDLTKGVVSTDVLTMEEVDSIYQHFSHPNLSDVPALFPLKFPTQQRCKYEDTIEMEIEKVSEFALEEAESYRLSDAVDIGGFSWNIWAKISTKDGNNEKWLGLLLCYDSSEKGSLIKISELLDPSKGFYNEDEDKVKLAIDVIVDEPKTEKFISDPNKSNGTLSMEIEKLSEFAREITWSERKSETVYVTGMPWKIIVQINTKDGNNEKWFGFALLCDASEKDGNWSRECSSTFRIVSQKNGVEDFHKTESDEKGIFNSEVTNRGFKNFISFAELMDPSKDLYNEEEDKVTLAIHLTYTCLAALRPRSGRISSFTIHLAY
ncbi:hypothetical protein niasHT_027780 [Heterodera trifolii]|uniref:MATH domain-containing protein n=1 Tax=Heterodera trifolii TaxID=157864 RepID=A0ABD2KID7_9BILA